MGPDLVYIKVMTHKFTCTVQRSICQSRISSIFHSRSIAPVMRMRIMYDTILNDERRATHIIINKEQYDVVTFTQPRQACRRRSGWVPLQRESDGSVAPSQEFTLTSQTGLAVPRCLRRKRLCGGQALRSHALCAHELHELIVADGLLLHELFDNQVQELTVCFERIPAHGVGAADNVLHRLVDALLRLLRSHAVSLDVGSLGTLPRRGAQLVRREAPLCHHPPRNIGDALQVARGTRRHVLGTKDELLCHTAAEGDSELGFEVAARVHARVLLLLRGHEKRESAGSVGSGHDGNLAHRVKARCERTHERVARLVVGDETLACVAGHAGALLKADGEAVEGVLDLAHGDLLLGPSRGHDGRLVHEVGEGRAGEAGRARGDGGHVHVRGEGLAAAVHAENGLAARAVREVHGHAAIEATGAEKGAVEHVSTVGGGDNHHASVLGKAVHLGEDLIERLLAFIVPSATCGARAA
mmetsp:Transcript_2395/g.6822  ORF Transcript_2395/g.6822 Transcript_2395/m.6822 type:complete len:471 (+) Transcript_2395:42-1454(+)